MKYMQVDSVMDKIRIVSDTIKMKSNYSIENNEIDFNWGKTFLTAFIGALIVQGLIILINYIKLTLELKTKKALLTTDLKNQQVVITKLKVAHQTLLDKFDNRNTLSLTCESFEDLHTDIYESVTKVDLFKIYKKEIFKIVNIYKTIRFLKEYSIDRIYKDYSNKLQNHLRENQDDPDHEFYCRTHIQMMNTAIDQIKNNINTIDEILVDIEEFIK